MKYKIKHFIFIIIFLLFSSSFAFAQWQPVVNLTTSNSATTSPNNAWCIAANGNFVHTVWAQSGQNGGLEIFYSRSIDLGSTWQSPSQLTSSVNGADNPSLAVLGSVNHLVWVDKRDGNNEIYYKRSTDAGTTWGADTRLTINTNESLNPSIAVVGSIVNVVWSDTRDGNSEIYYKRSLDGGLTWQSDTRLTNAQFNSDHPTIAVSGLTVHVSWFDIRNGSNEIFYKQSSDGGTTWGSDVSFTQNTYISEEPNLSVSGQIVHLVWNEAHTSFRTLMYKRSSDGGVTWGSNIELLHIDNLISSPSLTSLGNNVHLVWVRRDTTNLLDIYYKRSTDAGLNWDAGTRITNDPEQQLYPSIAVSGTKVHMIWTTGGTSPKDNIINPGIYYTQNPTGNPIGIINTSLSIPGKFKLEQNYPNPFNPTTNIKFDVAHSGFITLKIFDILGREVSTIVNENLTAGSYTADWNASNFNSGIYFYSLESENYKETKKMLLIK